MVQGACRLFGVQDLYFLLIVLGIVGFFFAQFPLTKLSFASLLGIVAPQSSSWRLTFFLDETDLLK